MEPIEPKLETKWYKSKILNSGAIYTLTILYNFKHEQMQNDIFNSSSVFDQICINSFLNNIYQMHLDILYPLS